jgi:hypothetical protein
LVEPESGLHCNLHPFQDSGTGKYPSPDLTGIDGGLRTHAHASDRLARVDPEGLSGDPGTITYPLHPTLAPQPGSCSIGIARAWAQEHGPVRAIGNGTVYWTSAQRQELLRTGRVRGYTGRYVDNAAMAPAPGDDPHNIGSLSNAHADLPNDRLYSNQGHRGGWPNSSCGRLFDRPEMIRRFRAECLRESNVNYTEPVHDVVQNGSQAVPAIPLEARRIATDFDRQVFGQAIVDDIASAGHLRKVNDDCIP